MMRMIALWFVVQRFSALLQDRAKALNYKPKNQLNKTLI